MTVIVDATTLSSESSDLGSDDGANDTTNETPAECHVQHRPPMQDERWPMPTATASNWGWDGSRIDWSLALGGLQEINGIPERYYSRRAG